MDNLIFNPYFERCVVRGKWFRPKPYTERLCSTCEVLGYEYDFLLQCTNKHQYLRLKFIARFYWERPSMHKFVELMSSQRRVVITKLAAFVHVYRIAKCLILFICTANPRLHASYLLYMFIQVYVAHRPMVTNGLC